MLTLAERRTSTSRNELSVTMDRMALSQGASSAGAGVAGIEAMDREATVLLGAGGVCGAGEVLESVRSSELVLEAVWEADLHNLACVESFLSLSTSGALAPN